MTGIRLRLLSNSSSGWPALVAEKRLMAELRPTVRLGSPVVSVRTAENLRRLSVYEHMFDTASERSTS